LRSRALASGGRSDPCSVIDAGLHRPAVTVIFARHYRPAIAVENRGPIAQTAVRGHDDVAGHRAGRRTGRRMDLPAVRGSLAGSFGSCRLVDPVSKWRRSGRR